MDIKAQRTQSKGAGRARVGRGRIPLNFYGIQHIERVRGTDAGWSFALDATAAAKMHPTRARAVYEYNEQRVHAPDPRTTRVRPTPALCVFRSNT